VLYCSKNHLAPTLWRALGRIGGLSLEPGALIFEELALLKVSSRVESSVVGAQKF
jgi:hypothetical protein